MADLSTLDMLGLIQQVAADLIQPRFRKLDRRQIHQKTPGDYVTAADQEAEAALTREFTQRYPGCLVVGEEASFADGSGWSGLASAEHAFVIDPVDGTNNFVQGHSDYATMVAELRFGEVVRSWIWQPEHGQAFVAEKGAGTTRNGVRLAVPQPHHPPLGATSRKSWRGFTAGGQLAPVVSTSFCAGVDYPRMLVGDLDYLAYQKPKPWDHLPGSLMLRELGGDIRGLDGEHYDAASTLVSIISAISPQICDPVREHWRVHQAELRPLPAP